MNWVRGHKEQGHLSNSDSKLSTKEMASIVTYGADQIFSSEKGTYTVAIDTNKNHRIG